MWDFSKLRNYHLKLFILLLFYQEKDFQLIKQKLAQAQKTPERSWKGDLKEETF